MYYFKNQTDTHFMSLSLYLKDSLGVVYGSGIGNPGLLSLCSVGFNCSRTFFNIILCAWIPRPKTNIRHI